MPPTGLGLHQSALAGQPHGIPAPSDENHAERVVAEAFAPGTTAAHQRGVKVRIMLNPARRGGEPENEATRKALEEAGVDVADTNPAIDLTHEKSMVIDDETAFIQSLNWETKNLTVTRDYAVVTSHRHEVDEVSACFDADWERKEFNDLRSKRALSYAIADTSISFSAPSST